MSSTAIPRELTVAALQYCAAGTPDDTMGMVIPLLEKAVDSGAQLVCLPEAASFLAGNRTALVETAEWEDASPTLDKFCELAVQQAIDIHLGSMMMRRRSDGACVNRGYLIAADGHISAQYDKIHMFDANVGDGRTYRESDHFAAGSRLVWGDSNGLKLGLSICYDLRFPALYRALAQNGADVLLVPAAFTFNSGRAHWHVLLRARAIETGCFVIAAAQCGTHADGRRTYGHSLIISPWGDILAEAPSDDGIATAGANDGVIVSKVTTEAVLKARNAIPSLSADSEFS